MNNYEIQLLENSVIVNRNQKKKKKVEEFAIYHSIDPFHIKNFLQVGPWHQDYSSRTISEDRKH